MKIGKLLSRGLSSKQYFVDPICIFYCFSNINIYFSTLQVAVGHEHQEQLCVHDSQKDFAKGFGGKYGIQQDRQDKVRFLLFLLN